MIPVVIRIGDKLRLSAKTGYYSRDSYLSQVGDVLGENLFLIYTPTAEGSFLKLPIKEEYILLFYTDNGLFQANGTVLDHVLINQVDYMKIQAFEYKRLQRRLFYRLDCVISFTFTKLSEQLLAEKQNEELKRISKQPQEIKAPVYKGVTKDISGGGLRFVSEVLLEQNEPITINFTLNPYENTSILVEGKVKTKSLLENFDNRYEYRIEFVNIMRGQQEQIVQYIFNVQNKQIKRFKPEKDDDF